ncbi:DUF1294 domain-containing protein [Paenibacillus filicis]|uniref:DUF1294 domain-containing protein n=1 Tax=Paenibacillus filicis TaxID=669464 RepID=A0ABU9DXF0_9BACL
MAFLWAYALLINAIGLILMAVDKGKARRKAWRIPEKQLFLVAAAGGSGGMWVGMRMWRHKTKHRSFTFGIPAIFIVQVVAILAIWGNQLPH